MDLSLNINTEDSQKNNTEESKESKNTVMITTETQTDDTLNPLYRPPSQPPKHLWRSIRDNWIFFLSLLGCCYAISKYTKYSFRSALLSAILISLYGYFTHMASHYISFTKIYNANDNYITRNKVLNFLCTQVNRFADFHDTTHHDTRINKRPANVIYEFINNFVFQGGIIVAFAYISRVVCIPSLLLWSLLYATVHNINYIIMPPKTHQNHHADKNTSYGLDIWDVIFNTKYDPDEIEVYNHMAINMICITAVLCYYYKRE